MARITRKELKTDEFALGFEHTVDFFEQYKTQIIRYGTAALIVAALVALIVVYRNHQATVRQEALSKAMAIQGAPVGSAAPGSAVSYPTEDAKTAAETKAFSEIAAKYSGTAEGYIAEYYLGSMAADQGKMGEADKRFSSVADAGDQKYASLAKLALAQVYFAEGKPDQGEQMLRALMSHPTVFVSRDQAALALAHMVAATNPAEARKLLDPLRAQSGPVGQAAIQSYGELQGR